MKNSTEIRMTTDWIMENIRTIDNTDRSNILYELIGWAHRSAENGKEEMQDEIKRAMKTILNDKF